MCAVLIGGMDRLRREYILVARELGFDLKIFTGQENNIKRQIGDPDIIVICTGKVSHNARLEALRHASAKAIRLEMIHSSGVSALRRCIKPQTVLPKAAAAVQAVQKEAERDDPTNGKTGWMYRCRQNYKERKSEQQTTCGGDRGCCVKRI
jgi:hypothetical protein